MNSDHKSTKFSTHLSRSRMRRYLHGQLNAAESQQVEMHLAHCTHCSAALVAYIELEETDQYNIYAQQLSGKLKEQKIVKRNSLSSFQIKAIRTVAAVVTLMIFSFFGVKNIISKEVAGYQPTELSSSVKAQPVVTSRKPLEEKVVVKPIEKKDDSRLAESRPTKKKAERSPASKSPVTTKKRVAAKKATPIAKKSTAQPQPKVNNPIAPVEKKAVAATSEKKEVKAKPVSVEKVAANNKPDVSTADKPEVDSQLATQPEVKPVRSMPSIKKMDAAKQVEVSKPVGSTAPSMIPVPGGRQR